MTKKRKKKIQRQNADDSDEGKKERRKKKKKKKNSIRRSPLHSQRYASIQHLLFLQPPVLTKKDPFGNIKYMPRMVSFVGKS